MDGRPHPPAWAPHTWQGFSTGKFDGDILTVYTTHIKSEWTRRNGLPNSEFTTMIEHFVRHGNIFTHVSIVTDPVYLTEPLVKSTDFRLNERPQGNWLWPCEYVDEVAGQIEAQSRTICPARARSTVSSRRGTALPLEATRGGAETMYPEYVQKIKNLPPPPAKAGSK